MTLPDSYYLQQEEEDAWFSNGSSLCMESISDANDSARSLSQDALLTIPLGADSRIDSGFMQRIPAIDFCEINAENKNRQRQTVTSGNEDLLVGDFARMSVEQYQNSDNVNKLTHCDSDCQLSVAQEKARNMLLFLSDADGDTSLHMSIVHEDDKMAHEIINSAPDFVYLNIPNNLGQTPAHLAVLTNAPKTLRKLICAGADVTCQDMRGNTPLHIACVQGKLEIAKQFLRPIMYEETIENKYALPLIIIPQNMKVKNFEGLTCLHLAVLHNHFDIARLLLEVGADVNGGDGKSGRTPLHWAAEQGLFDLVCLLASYPETCIDVQSYSGHTPAQLAFSRGHVKVMEWLMRRGAYGGFLYCGDISDDSEYSSNDSFIRTGNH